MENKKERLEVKELIDQLRFYIDTLTICRHGIVFSDLTSQTIDDGLYGVEIALRGITDQIEQVIDKCKENND